MELKDGRPAGPLPERRSRGVILLTILLAAAANILFSYLLIYAVHPAGDVLSDDWIHSSGARSEHQRLPATLILKEPSLHEWEIEFDKPDGQGPVLIIARPLGYAMEVRLNGKVIERIGSLENPTEHMWNNSFSIGLGEGLQKRNILNIRTFGYYDAGFLTAPYIVMADQARFRMFLNRFLFYDLQIFSISAGAFLGIVLITLACLEMADRKTFFYMGIASLAMAAYCFDYVPQSFFHNVTVMFWMRKIYLAAGFFSAAAFIKGLQEFSRRKILFHNVVAGLALGCSLLLLSAWNFQVFYLFFNVSLAVLMAGLAVSVYLLFAVSRSRILFTFLFINLALSIVQANFIVFFRTSWPFTIPYVMLLSIAAFSTYLVSEWKSVNMRTEKLEKELYTDSLTGAYNRRFLEENPGNWSTVIVADLDYLKRYNDRYGHPQGDRLLTEFVELLKGGLREEDAVVRYGGDEFLLLLSDADVDQAERVMHRLLEAFRRNYPDSGIGFSYGIEAVRYRIDAAIHQADLRMYRMKERQRQVKIEKHSREGGYGG